MKYYNNTLDGDYLIIDMSFIPFNTLHRRHEEIIKNIAGTAVYKHNELILDKIRYNDIEQVFHYKLNKESYYYCKHDFIDITNIVNTNPDILQDESLRKILL